MLPWMRTQWSRGEAVCLSSLDDVPADQPDREVLRNLGVKSTATFPLIVGGRTIGVLAFGTIRHERPWDPGLVNRLRLVAQVFASALARQRNDRALRDALTEVERLRDQLRDENEYLRQEVSVLQGPSLLTGRSQAIQETLQQVRHVAPTAATVLLTGETGTGKELLAAEIHALSPRRTRPMVRVNCAAIPSALVENELFGREKGAYTGALVRQAGRFEVADKSTIFLDEIGDLPLDVQVKLLRVLQDRQVERLGSSTPIHLDVRVIAATNHDLAHGIAQGTFREDLFYRLNVFPIRVPPLRERVEDVPLLVWSFVDEFAKAYNKRVDAVSKETMRTLERYSWPGNVRELRNVIERAVIVATGPVLMVPLPQTLQAPSVAPPEGVALVDMERAHIAAVLDRTRWRIRGAGGAAELLEMKPSTLESRMAKLGLRRRADWSPPPTFRGLPEARLRALRRPAGRATMRTVGNPHPCNSLASS
jgi:transcriptional regulator with GAF, ATPase, and Fis domain